MKRIILFPLLAVWMFTACTAQEAVEQPAAEAVQVVAESTVPAVDTAQALPTKTTVPPTSAPLLEDPTALPPAESAPLQPTSVPTTPPQAAATVAITAQADETALMQVISGQTAEGAYFYGDPNAAVTLIDYSDFL